MFGAMRSAELSPRRRRLTLGSPHLSNRAILSASKTHANPHWYASRFRLPTGLTPTPAAWAARLSLATLAACHR